MTITQHIKGPFLIEDFGDWFYVTSESGVRVADIDGDNARSKAEQVCAALNAVHYLSEAMGGKQ